MSSDSVTQQLCSYATESNSSGKDGPSQITASNGCPVSTITASMTAGAKGSIVLKDFTLIDHLAAFDRERIPERVVHAKGAGAFGYFEVTSTAITQYCRSKMFESVGKRTEIAARFSTVGGESGSADTARDPRGFAIKFYTEEGNWDMVGNNTPIFFIRDPILFPSFIHTQKRNPQTHCKDPNMMWDFITLRPETIHQVSFLFSDRGTPDGYRHMNGYSSHAFKTVNTAGHHFYVKWHFKTDQGIRNLSPEEAEKLSASDPDYAIRDLFNAISTKAFPSWTLFIQVMTPQQAEESHFNPFDLTKVWSHKEFPLIEVGRLVLDRNPSNYFAEVEQLAFSPAHLVPGIEPSPDKMLQARLFSYSDTHRHRLGQNYQQIPVNCPFATKVNNFQRDGAMNVNGNQGNAPNYFPNSFGGPEPVPSASWHSESTSGDVARYETGGDSDDNYSQCATFFRKVLSVAERERLADNIAGNLVNAEEFIQRRAIAHFAAVDASYGRMVQDRLQKLKSKPVTVGKKAEAASLSPPRSISHL